MCVSPLHQPSKPHTIRLRKNLLMFLSMHLDTLSTSKCVMLAPRFCGPFIILKCICLFTCYLNLTNGVNVHCVYDASCLEELRSHKMQLIIRILAFQECIYSKPKKTLMFELNI